MYICEVDNKTMIVTNKSLIKRTEIKTPENSTDFRDTSMDEKSKLKIKVSMIVPNIQLVPFIHDFKGDCTTLNANMYNRKNKTTFIINRWPVLSSISLMSRFAIRAPSMVVTIIMEFSISVIITDKINAVFQLKGLDVFFFIKACCVVRNCVENAKVLINMQISFK